MDKKRSKLFESLKELHARFHGDLKKFHYQQHESVIRLIIDGRVLYRTIKWTHAQEDVTLKVRMYNVFFLQRYD